MREDALWRPATSDVIDAASSRGAHSDRQPTDSFDERRAGRMSDNDVLMPWDERGRWVLHVRARRRVWCGRTPLETSPYRRSSVLLNAVE